MCVCGCVCPQTRLDTDPPLPIPPLFLLFCLAWSSPPGRNPPIDLRFIMQSLFEAAMYTFVFMWTPALDRTQGGQAAVVAATGGVGGASAAGERGVAAVGGGEASYGLVFACFMAAIMIGSSLFRMMVGAGLSVERVTRFLLVGAFLALSVGAVSVTSFPVLFSWWVTVCCVCVRACVVVCCCVLYVVVSVS